jgi:hypothetical protein
MVVEFLYRLEVIREVLLDVRESVSVAHPRIVTDVALVTVVSLATEALRSLQSGRSRRHPNRRCPKAQADRSTQDADEPCEIVPARLVDATPPGTNLFLKRAVCMIPRKRIPLSAAHGVEVALKDGLT